MLASWFRSKLTSWLSFSQRNNLVKEIGKPGWCVETVGFSRTKAGCLDSTLLARQANVAAGENGEGSSAQIYSSQDTSMTLLCLTAAEANE